MLPQFYDIVDRGKVASKIDTTFEYGSNVHDRFEICTLPRLEKEPCLLVGSFEQVCDKFLKR